MADLDRDAFMSAIATAMRRQKREQKSDDIIEFLKAHWDWFFYRRSSMLQLMDGMGNQFPATVDAFCDQLGIPENVWFKRTPINDIKQLYLTFETSRAKKLFIDCVNKSRNHEACLFLVTGKSSMCITNMQTTFPPGRLICYQKSTGDLPDIHIFKANEVPLRLPNLFTKTGD